MIVALKGPCKAAIRLIDASGRTLMEQIVVATGSPTVQANTTLDLELEAADGKVSTAPVLAVQSNPNAVITFDGKNAEEFTVDRCRAIGCTEEVTQRAAKGQVDALAPQRLELPTLAQRTSR